MWAHKREEQHFQAFSPETIGPNTIFLSVFPVVVALAVQLDDIRSSLIAGTVLAGVVAVLGITAYWISARRVALYLLDSVILISLVVQLGVSYPYKWEIARCFNFIFFATLAGMGVISLLVGYPFTLQHVREGVPREAWRHPHVMHAAFVTTAICVATFTINTLLYLVPVAQDVWYDRTHPLTIMFQVVLPCMFYVLALLAVRLAPYTISSHLQDSKGFSSVQPAAITNNLAHV